MVGISITQAQTLLDNWVNLLTQLSRSPAHSITFEGRSYTGKDIKQVQEQVTFWENKVGDLENKAARKSRSVRVNPAW